MSTFLEYNPSNGNMYVTSSVDGGSGHLSVIDSDTNEVIYNMSIGDGFPRVNRTPGGVPYLKLTAIPIS